MVGEDRYQSLKGRGIGAQKFQVLIVAEGGYLSSVYAF